MADDGSAPRPAGERLAGSYVNFYIGNSTVVMPLLDARRDRRGGAHVAARSFPDRRFIGVQAREILLGGGNIHCITQQVPLRAEPARTRSARLNRDVRSAARPRRAGQLRAPAR